MKACPSGEQTRQCNEWGDWGAIDYSNCRCKAVDGFEATRVDSYATADCLDINGMPDGSFRPYDTATREQACAVLCAL